MNLHDRVRHSGLARNAGPQRALHSGQQKSGGPRGGPEAEAKKHNESFPAHLRELEYDLKSGAVVPVGEVAKRVADEYSIVYNRVLSISAEVAPRFAIFRSAEDVQALLAKEIAKVLEELVVDKALAS